jgi:hypothetical protein
VPHLLIVINEGDSAAVFGGELVGGRDIVLDVVHPVGEVVVQGDDHAAKNAVRHPLAELTTRRAAKQVRDHLVRRLRANHLGADARRHHQVALVLTHRCHVTWPQLQIKLGQVRLNQEKSDVMRNSEQICFL